MGGWGSGELVMGWGQLDPVERLQLDNRRAFSTRTPKWIGCALLTPRQVLRGRVERADIFCFLIG